MKKKVLSAIVCAAMVFSMTACGLQSPNTATGNSGTTNAATSDAATSDAGTSDAEAADTTTEAASTGDSATEPVGPAVTLVYAEVNPLEGTIVGQTATAFKDKVEELSGGSITIDIQANGVLGAESDVLDTLFAVGAKDKEKTEFDRHWFMQVQAGAAYTLGETGFGDLLSPAAALSAGYRFSPVWAS